MTPLHIQGGKGRPVKPNWYTTSGLDKRAEWQAEHPVAEAFYEDGTVPADGNYQGELALQYLNTVDNTWLFESPLHPKSTGYGQEPTRRVWLIPKQPGAVKEETSTALDSTLLIKMSKESFDGFEAEILRNGGFLTECAESNFNTGYLNGFYDGKSHARQQENGWVKLVDETPTPDSEILVYCPKTGKVTLEVYFGNKRFSSIGFNNVTHWMPIPAAPQSLTK